MSLYDYVCRCICIDKRTYSQTHMCYVYNMYPLLLDPGYFLGWRVNPNLPIKSLILLLVFTRKNMGLPLNHPFLPLFFPTKHDFAVSGSRLAGSFEGTGTGEYIFKYEHVCINEFGHKLNRCKPNHILIDFCRGLLQQVESTKSLLLYWLSIACIHIYIYIYI